MLIAGLWPWSTKLGAPILRQNKDPRAKDQVQVFARHSNAQHNTYFGTSSGLFRASKRRPGGTKVLGGAGGIVPSSVEDWQPLSIVRGTAVDLLLSRPVYQKMWRGSSRQP